MIPLKEYCVKLTIEGVRRYLPIQKPSYFHVYVAVIDDGFELIKYQVVETPTTFKWRRIPHNTILGDSSI